MGKQSWFARRGAVRVLFAAILLGVFLLSSGTALARIGMPAIHWWAVGSGGGSQSAGDVTLDSTLGLPVVGESSAGNIGVMSGYWNASALSASPGELPVFLPFVQR